MSEKRIGTYIKGFDEQLGGGIPQKHIVLIAGTAGTMKSSIAYNIIHNNSRDNGVNSVYISLEQSRKSLMDQMSKLEMEKLPDEKLAILDLGMIRKKLTSLGERSLLELFKMNVDSLIKHIRYDMVVIDSLSALELIAKFDKPREDLFRLFEWLRDSELTAILILETDPDSDKIGSGGESFLADGIITLDMEEVNSIDVQRRIRCLKMRGTEHHTGYFNLLFKDNKFQVTKAITP
jgi:KaiC/GvpD/RAD55 family RecA-like ATPase